MLLLIFFFKLKFQIEIFSTVFNFYLWGIKYFCLAQKIYMIASCLHQANIFAVVVGGAIADLQWPSLMLKLKCNKRRLMKSQVANMATRSEFLTQFMGIL